MNLAIRMAQTANQALRDNPAVRSVGEMWVLNAAKARQCAEDWSRDGIPENIVLGAISRVCGQFQPSPENPRIGSFRYFDAAVRKAWKDAQQGDALDAAFANLE